MSRLMTHAVVAFLASLLAFSVFYVFAERDKFTTVLYGYPSRLIIAPNTNSTIPLAFVSDADEVGSLTVYLSTWTLSNQSSSILKPPSYNFEISLSATVEVNKSVFVLLEEWTLEDNKTVAVTAFHSSNFPLTGPGAGTTETSTLQANIELNRHYQLKIGNYETFIVNQTGPLRFTTQDTNRSLKLEVTAPYSLTNDPRVPHGYNVAITFIREPSLYLVTGLLILDATLIAAYLVAYKKMETPREKTSNL